MALPLHLYISTTLKTMGKRMLKFVKIVNILTLSILLTACGFKSGSKEVGGIKQISDSAKGGGGDTGTEGTRPPKNTITKSNLEIQSCEGFTLSEFNQNDIDKIKNIFSNSSIEKFNYEIKSKEILKELIDIHRIKIEEIAVIDKYELVGRIDKDKASLFFESELLGEKMKDFLGCNPKLPLGVLKEISLANDYLNCVSKIVVATDSLYIGKMRCINRDTMLTKTYQVSQ
jgi:hypothetical protein